MKVKSLIISPIFITLCFQYSIFFSSILNKVDLSFLLKPSLILSLKKSSLAPKIMEINTPKMSVSMAITKGILLIMEYSFDKVK
jgi:hypothetical protein